MRLHAEVRRTSQFLLGNKGIDIAIRFEAVEDLIRYENFQRLLAHLFHRTEGLLALLPLEPSEGSSRDLINTRGSAELASQARPDREVLLRVLAKTPLRSEALKLLFETRFKSFPSSRLIKYEMITEDSLLSRFVSFERLEFLTRLIPIEITRVEIGIEHFRARSLGSLVGLGPTIYSWTQLKLSRENFDFRLKYEGSARGVELADVPYTKKLASALRSAQIEEDLLSKIKS